MTAYDAANTHVLMLGAFTPMLVRLWSADVTTSLMCDAGVLARQTGLHEHRTLTVTDEATPPEHLRLAVRIHQIQPLTHAVALDDEWMQAAALIRTTLGLGGGNPHEVVAAVHDKYRYRSTLTRAGLTKMEHALAAGPEDIVQFGTVHGWPVVVKPRYGSGSDGVRTGVIGSTAERAYTHAIAHTIGTDRDHALIEQQATGRLITVDTFSHDGDHRVVSIGFELVAHPRPVVICTGMPAPLTGIQRSAITDTVTNALTELGVTTGPAHTELFLHGDEPILIETQLRLGGDFPELTQATLGLDPYDLWARQLLGHNPLPTIESALATPSTTAGVMLWGGPNVAGTYRQVRGIPDEQTHPDVGWVRVIAQPPVPSRPVESLTDAPVGILCSGPTLRHALRRAQRALGGVTMRVALESQLPRAPHDAPAGGLEGRS